MIEIKSKQNSKIKLAKSLKLKKNRLKTNLFIVEGLHHVGQAIEAGLKIDFVLYAENESDSTYTSKLLQIIEKKGIQVYLIPKDVYQSLSEKENIQSFIAIAHQKLTSLENLPHFEIGVGLVTPQNPGNIGTILRSIDAAGADVLFLIDGGADPYHPSCVRASMGTLFWKPIVQLSFEEFQNYIEDNEINLYGTSVNSAKNYKNFEYQKPSVLLLGSEQKGLSPEHLSQCDDVLTIKMQGRASSLNLASAVSILLFSMQKN